MSSSSTDTNCTARCTLYDFGTLKDYFCQRAKLNLWSISMTCSLWMKMSECDMIDNVNTQSMPSVKTKDAYHTAWHKIQVMSQLPLPFMQDFTGVILYGLTVQLQLAWCLRCINSVDLLLSSIVAHIFLRIVGTNLLTEKDAKCNYNNIANFYSL